MLSPHELAKLFVLVYAPENADVEGPELAALVERDLVQCVARNDERVEIRVTPYGADVLARLARAGWRSAGAAKRA